jgi:hypothetical protein
VVEPERIETIMALARRGLAPSAAERQRLRASLAGRVGAAYASSAGVASVPRGWAALKASGKRGLALGAALVGVGFAAGVLFAGARSTEALSVAPPVGVVAAPAATEAARIEPVSMTPLGAAPSAQAPPATEPKPRARPPRPRSTRSDAFGRELALVRRAERAIRNRDPALALGLLDELDREHPNAQLAEERAAARVMARCQAEEPTAPLEAARFLRESPKSVYSERVRALCALGEGGRRVP